MRCKLDTEGPSPTVTPGTDYRWMQAIGCMLCLLAGLYTTRVHAQTGTDLLPAPENNHGGYFELGVTTAAERTFRIHDYDALEDTSEIWFSLTANGAYRYHSLFVEAVLGSVDGGNLGLSLLQGEHWNVDLLLGSLSGSVTVGESDNGPPLSDADRSRELIEGDALFIGAGARVTGYFGPWITQFRLVSDWYESHGLIANARLGHQWQVGKWNLHAIGGLRYFSDRTAQFWWGVDDDEATDQFPAYTARGSVAIEGEAGVAYPLAKDWVFRSTLGARHHTGDALDSPLTRGSGNVLFETSLVYVF